MASNAQYAAEGVKRRRQSLEQMIDEFGLSFSCSRRLKRCLHKIDKRNRVANTVSCSRERKDRAQGYNLEESCRKTKDTREEGWLRQDYRAASGSSKPHRDECT